MWFRGWRNTVWSELNKEWDIVVVGGGITGAGILSEASRLGLRVLLIEGQDFASGTTSRSSKLVHGGLRYLRNAQFGLTRESVVERERLLREGQGLVLPLGFYLTSFEGDKTKPWVMGAGLALYDLLASKWAHESLDKNELLERCPTLKGAPLVGGYHYLDAQTDDARLCLRVIREAVARGAFALNYARATNLLRDDAGHVAGIVVTDDAPETRGRTHEVRARVVINATGAFADDLRSVLGSPRKLRKIRGSHLIFSQKRFPLPEAVCMMHPKDGRAIFAIPWEGVTMYGTTDADHNAPTNDEPFISAEEHAYLFEGMAFAFPSLKLEPKDVLTSFAGVRAVVDTGKSDPSKESREHVLWNEHGLVTVTGGKLTTFRVMALDALKAVSSLLPEGSGKKRKGRILDENPTDLSWPVQLDDAVKQRLAGRLGADVKAILGNASELSSVDGGISLWAELRWAARAEGVVRLEDLLLRRVRLGFLSKNGGLDQMDRIGAIVREELGWDEARWRAELDAYKTTWTRCYSPNPAGSR